MRCAGPSMYVRNVCSVGNPADGHAILNGVGIDEGEGGDRGAAIRGAKEHGRRVIFWKGGLWLSGHLLGGGRSDGAKISRQIVASGVWDVDVAMIEGWWLAVV